MKRIRTAVIGGGHLGRIHTKLLRQHPDFAVVAVCDPQPLVQQRLIEEFDVRVVSQHHKILDEVDAAVIATPTTLHAEIALECLAHGIHLLVEKPLTAQAESARGVELMARERDLVVQVGHVERYNPAIAAAVRAIGAPRFVSAVRASSFPFRSTDIGCVFDLMIHDIDLVNALFDAPVAETRAWGMAPLGRHEEIADAHLTFAHGGVAHLRASRCSPQPQRTWQVFGDRGCATIDLVQQTVQLIQFPSWLREGQVDLHELPQQVQTSAREQFFENVLPTRMLDFAKTNAIGDEHHEWAAAIRGQRPSRVALRQAVQAVEIGQEIVSQISRSAQIPAPAVHFPAIGLTGPQWLPEPAVPVEFLPSIPPRQAA